MKELINDLFERYPLQSIEKSLAEDFLEPLKVAVLGEFSAGKSTLINAMIGQIVLPSMPTPTSKCLTTIGALGEIEEPQRYSLDDEGNKSHVSNHDFQDIATGKIKGTLFVEVPENEFFEEDLFVIDTPGLKSLDQTDSDITFGLLPNLDGAIICQDIQQGALPDSILTFLKSDIMKDLRDSTVVVLTYADTKDSAGVAAVKDTVEKQLVDLTYGSGHHSPVIALDAKSAINNSELLIPLKRIFVESIRSRKQQMRERRQQIIIIEAADAILEQLNTLKELSSSDTVDVQKAIAKQEDSLKNIRVKRAELNQRLDKMHTVLAESLLKVGKRHESVFTSLADGKVGAVEAACDALTKDLGEEIQQVLKIFFQNIELDTLSQSVTAGLSSRIKRIINNKDTGVTLATATLIAVVAPGVGVLANAGEFAAGGAAKAALKGGAKVVAKKAAAAVALEAMRNAMEIKKAKDTVDDAMKEGNCVTDGIEIKETNLARKTLMFVASTIDEINPIEHAGRFVANQFIKGATAEELRKITQSCSDVTKSAIRNTLEMKVFPEIEGQIKDHRAQLYQLQDEMQRKGDEYRKWSAQLTDDTVRLQQIIRNFK